MGRTGITRREMVAGAAAWWLAGQTMPARAVEGATTGILLRYPWLLPLTRDEGFSPHELERFLGSLTVDHRVVGLMDRQAEARPYHEYRQRFIDRHHVERGREKLRLHRQLLQEVEERFGVPGDVLVALWGVESNFGKSQGGFKVLRTLFSLAVGYPRRAEFFQDELRHFLVLCREEGWTPAAIEGSYAGAMSQAQMMPSSFRRYAVDFDGDGKRRLFTHPADVLASIASYLEGHQWRPRGRYALEQSETGLPLSVREERLDQTLPWREWMALGVVFPESVPPGPDEMVGLITLEGETGRRYYLVFDNFRVVVRWNRSYRFAMAVGELSGLLRLAG